MNQTHFCSQTLSDKLSLLDCVPQFHFFHVGETGIAHDQRKLHGLLFHFSDILIPSNYVKIFGEPQKLGGHPFYAIYFPWDKQVNWEQWLNEAADEMLKKIQSHNDEMAKETKPATQMES